MLEAKKIPYRSVNPIDSGKALTHPILATNKSVIPVIFIHKGYSPYLEYTLRQVQLSNPQTPIFLFGDDSNRDLTASLNVNHVDIAQFERTAFPFEKIYKHFSHKGHDFEMYCIKRYYVVQEIMREFDFDNVFICDSDLMIYCNLTEEAKRLNLDGYNVAFHVHPAEWFGEVVAHSSYWTRQGLDQLCMYITELYTNQLPRLERDYLDRLSRSMGTLISDNYILYRFYQEFKDQLSILDLTPIRDGIALDLIMNDWLMGTNYEMVEDIWFSIKKVYKENGAFYCFDKAKKQKIKFHTFHFNDSSKGVLHRYYQGNDLKSRQLKDEIRYKRQQIKKMLRLRTRINMLKETLGKFRRKDLVIS